MTITVEIPDALAGALSAQGKDPARAVLEAMVLEGYRSDQLSEADVKELLGFETRLEVHEFLKNHGVFMHYSLDDLDRDTASATAAAARRLGTFGERHGLSLGGQTIKDLLRESRP